MSPNPLLKKLGFSDKDRVVILHADDIGMCHASLAAYAGLVDFGLVSSAAVMTPCSWFPATAAFCREHQETQPHLDMGVHATLNSEWDSYRWGPLSTKDPASGLIDVSGYFYARVEPVHMHAEEAAVQHEVQVQIERALAAGIDVTHVDSHMATLFHPRLLIGYIESALAYQLPPLLFRYDEAAWRRWGLDVSAAVFLADRLRELEERGVPLLDHVYMMPLDDGQNRLEVARQALAELPAGLSYFLIHPCVDTPELRALAPDWRARVADYELFTSEAMRQAVADAGVQVIGWRLLRNLMRGLGD